MNWAANITDADRRARVENFLATANVVECCTVGEKPHLLIVHFMFADGESYHHANLYPMQEDGGVNWSRDAMYCGQGDCAASAADAAKSAVMNWEKSDLSVNAKVRVLQPDKWAGLKGIIEEYLPADAPQRVFGKRYGVAFHENGALLGTGYFRQDELELIPEELFHGEMHS